MAEGQLTLPEKEKWVVKTDLETFKRSRDLQVIMMSPAKASSLVVFTVVILQETFSLVT